MRILIADDETDLTDALQDILAREHYSVDVVDNGNDALDYGLAENYDCIVLDIMMPGRDGLSVLAALREQGVSTPILLLTAKSEIGDRIQGLDAGADDYLPKPFNIGEFLARVRAMTRRAGSFTPNLLSIGNITLDRTTFVLQCGENTIRLANKEFQMLELLLRQQGRFISTEQFMERIWGYESEAEQNVVWAYVSYLRKKLGAIGANVCIAASRGRGYLLEVAP
ncbi:response regulator transcription factor [Butyricicoccus faecihominis]|uniref:response regulator transcription factor n=1 Tax=Butyricicoccaceae TaxID=3085642 RepID=UPI00247AE574|nr:MULTISPECIES: response regulator transcription factor [Butyricicoccaceae]MCQ5130071.1 response regulator transcription factor [Butyricicoccus faecihominis]WNX85482.1 response regulator transcription factor [Agathobaculum sp. NTUH-O15-33]